MDASLNKPAEREATTAEAHASESFCMNRTGRSSVPSKTNWGNTGESEEDAKIEMLLKSDIHCYDVSGMRRKII